MHLLLSDTTYRDNTWLSFKVSLCVYTYFTVYVGLFFLLLLLFFFLLQAPLSGLQVLKSMRFNTSSNLTPWHHFEASKVRLERHGSSFSPQSRGFMSLGWGQLSFHWSVVPQRERQSCHLKRLTCIFFMTLKASFYWLLHLFSPLVAYVTVWLCLYLLVLKLSSAL